MYDPTESFRCEECTHCMWYMHGHWCASCLEIEIETIICNNCVKVHIGRRHSILVNHNFFTLPLADAVSNAAKGIKVMQPAIVQMTIFSNLGTNGLRCPERLKL